MTTLDELERLREAATKYFALPVSGDEGCMKIWDAQTRLIADVRSWGYLTGKGVGALGLSDEEALKVQRELMALIVAAINALPGLIESARRVERLEAALKQSQEPDMFWDQDDPERPYYSIEELLREREYDRDKDIVIETSEAISCDYGAYLCRIISADEDADDNGPTFSIRKLTEDERKEYRNVERIWYAIRNLKPLFVARAALKEQTP